MEMINEHARALYEIYQHGTDRPYWSDLNKTDREEWGSLAEFSLNKPQSRIQSLEAKLEAAKDALKLVDDLYGYLETWSRLNSHMLHVFNNPKSVAANFGYGECMAHLEKDMPTVKELCKNYESKKQTLTQISERKD